MAENLYNGALGSVLADNLFAGSKVPVLIKGVTFPSGTGILKRGTVVGIITTSGNGAIVNSSNTDGSQTAKYILAGDIDATSAAVTAECYASGEFNRKALIFGGTDTYATHEDTLRKYNIILHENIAY